MLNSDTDAIRIVMIDGHELLVEGIRAVIENEAGLTIIGHAADRLQRDRDDTVVGVLVPRDVPVHPGAERGIGLLVHGERDPAISAPQDGWFEGLNSTFHRIVFEDSRHFPMLEEGAKFNRLLQDFLESEDPTSLRLKEEWKRRMR